MDNDSECYGWNNETYFCQILWRNQRWQLQHQQYLIEVSIISSAKKVVGYYRIINDVSILDFRLEAASLHEIRLIKNTH